MGEEVPIWARERPRRRPALSRDAIVETAVRIADAEGLDAVSIRRVAGELGVRAMSLYTYIDRKEDLLALMREQINSEVLLGEDRPDDWRKALTEIARRTRELMLRHRWLIGLVGTTGHGQDIGPNALRHLEESLAALQSIDLDPYTVSQILFAVDKYTVGHVIFEITTHPGAQTEVLRQPYIRSLLESGEFPLLAAIMSSHLAADRPTSDEVFERGLTWLLDGIAAEID